MDEKEDVMNIKPLLPHSDVILYLGQDDKASVHVGRSVPLSDVTQQSTGAIVGQYQIFITADHDWNYERVIPSVTLRMDITQTYGKSLYSGGTNVPGYIFSWFIIQPLIVQIDSNVFQIRMRS